MFFVYILKSIKSGTYYVGATRDLTDRINRHNSGSVKSTKGLAPFEIVYTEQFLTNSEARKRESFIKRRKSRKYIESLIELESKNRSVA